MVKLTKKSRDEGCEHLADVADVIPSARGCTECEAEGGQWVHLRICMSCGHVACCNSSPKKHASKHHEQSGHPIIRSFEPGENWAWCYIDERSF